jgi:hypothetical protein
MDNKFYLQLEASTGSLYEYSKTEKDGFERNVYVGKDGVEKISYRRYHKEGIFGTLRSIRRREAEMDGKKVLQVSVAMVSEDNDVYYISFPLKNGKGDIQDYAVSVLSYLPNLKEGTAYRFFPYAIEDKETKRKTYGVSIMYARLSDRAVDKTNKIPRLTYEIGDGNGGVKTPGDIPRLEWEMVMDKPTPNAKKRNDYLWNIFKEYEIEGSGFSGGGVKTFDSTAETDAAPSPQQAPAQQGIKPSKPVQEAAPAESLPTSQDVAPTPEVAKAPKSAMRPSQDFETPKAAPAPAPAVAEEEDDFDLPF